METLGKLLSAVTVRVLLFLKLQAVNPQTRTSPQAFFHLQETLASE